MARATGIPAIVWATRWIAVSVVIALGARVNAVTGTRARAVSSLPRT
jgi:hypothetical protein